MQSTVKSKNIILTTYPAHKSKNVGDSLITNSFLKLIRNRIPDFQYEVVFREKALEGFTKKVNHNLILPGFSVSNGVYPDLFRLFTDLGRIKSFFAFGCSFQHVIPSKESFFSESYDKKTHEFLKYIVDRFGPLHCRDQLIVERLNRFGLAAIFSGDAALFNEVMVGTDFKSPSDIRSVAISLQHHIKYLEQSINLMKKIKRRFPDAKKYITLHSTPSEASKVLCLRAEEIGFQILHLYGDSENLSMYDTIDLHIGYRLHAHIYSLRMRKPSILLVEDARSFGFSRTPGLDVGCIDAFSFVQMEADDIAPEKAMSWLEGQLACRFQDYQAAFSVIDEVYRDVVVPYLDQMINKIHAD